MGWLSGWNSRDEVVAHLTKEIGERLVRSTRIGKVLWTVERKPAAGGLFIGCYLLSGGRESYDGSSVGRGGDRSWGYKDLCESMGPVEVTCPLAYLALVPQADGAFAGPWRERVRAYHAKRVEQTAIAGAARVGDRIELREGCKPSVLTVTERRGSALVCSCDGIAYRVAAAQVRRVLGPPAG